MGVPERSKRSKRLAEGAAREKYEEQSGGKGTGREGKEECGGVG